MRFVSILAYHMNHSDIADQYTHQLYIRGILKTHFLFIP